MITAQQLIKLRVYEQQPVVVHEKWCQEQQDDFALIIENVDDLIATAINAGSSQQSYETLIGAKNQFVTNLLNVAENYRYVKRRAK